MEEAKTDSPPVEEVLVEADEPTEVAAPPSALLEVGNICYLHPGRTQKPLLADNGALAPQHADKDCPYETRNPPRWFTVEKTDTSAAEVSLEETADTSRVDITIRIPKDLRRTFVRGSVFAIWINLREYGLLTFENFSSTTVQVGNGRHCSEQPAKILLDRGEHVLFFHGRGLQLQMKLKFQHCQHHTDDENGWQMPTQMIKALTTNQTTPRLIESAGEEFDANAYYDQQLQNAKEVKPVQQQIPPPQRKAPGPIARLLAWFGLGRDYDEYEDEQQIEAMNRHTSNNWMNGDTPSSPTPPTIDITTEPPTYLSAKPPHTNGNGNGHHGSTNGVTPPPSDLENLFRALDD